MILVGLRVMLRDFRWCSVVVRLEHEVRSWGGVLGLGMAMYDS